MSSAHDDDISQVYVRDGDGEMQDVRVEFEEIGRGVGSVSTWATAAAMVVTSEAAADVTPHA